jgi:hypothetical protein
MLRLLLCFMLLASSAAAQFLGNSPGFPYLGTPPGAGDVEGPGTSTVGRVPIFSNTTGDLLGESLISQTAQNLNLLAVDPEIRFDTGASGFMTFGARGNVQWQVGEGGTAGYFRVLDLSGGPGDTLLSLDVDTATLDADADGDGEGVFQVFDSGRGEFAAEYDADSGEWTFQSGSGADITLNAAGTSDITLDPSDGVVRLEDGTIMLAGDRSCATHTGLVGQDTLCDDGGVLSVRHGTGAPISLEGVGGGGGGAPVWTTQEYNTTPQTAADGEFITLDTSSTAITVNLPDCAGGINGNMIVLKLRTKGVGNDVTVTPDAGATIDGDASLAITFADRREELVCFSASRRWER